MTERARRRLAAIVSTDVVGYSRLMGADEAGTLARMKAHRVELWNPEIEQHGGRIVGTAGDSLLVEFASAVSAVECALALQQGMAEREAGRSDDTAMLLRIGVNIGEVVVDGDDIYGDGVNVAARLQAIAPAGGICLSGKVHDEVDGKIAAAFEDAGPQEVKNIARPVQVWRWRLDTSHAPATTAAPDAALPLPEKPSVAVLPFDNMSDDPEQAYFSDGITEDIITELSKISGLFVIARHSAFTYKGKSVTLRQVGRELGVRYVLEGSVRKAGSRLRITAQLIDAATDHHVWAERFDRGMADIFAVQDEVARAVASALAVALRPDEGARLGRPPTDDIDAYDTYLRTRGTPWPPTRDHILAARLAYRRIAELDPSFAGGPAGLSVTHALAILFGHSDRPDDDIRLARESSEAAVALDAGFAPAHSALGLAHCVAGRHDAAVACARRAIELQPGDAEVHLYATFCLLGDSRFDAAQEAITTALRLDPQYVAGPYLNTLGFVCFAAGRHEAALDALRRNVERGGPMAAPALVFRAGAAGALGRADEARETARTLLTFQPDFAPARLPLLHMFRDPEVTRRMVEALRAAGLPD
jgi:adenylate cyclase